MQLWCSSVKHSWQLVSALSTQKVNSSSSASAKCLPGPSGCCPDTVSVSAAFSSGLSRDGSKKLFNLWSQSSGHLSVTESWQPLPTHPTHPASAAATGPPAMPGKEPGASPAASRRRAVGMTARTGHRRARPTRSTNWHGTAQPRKGMAGAAGGGGFPAGLSAALPAPCLRDGWAGSSGSGSARATSRRRSWQGWPTWNPMREEASVAWRRQLGADGPSPVAEKEVL